MGIDLAFLLKLLFQFAILEYLLILLKTVSLYLIVWLLMLCLDVILDPVIYNFQAFLILFNLAPDKHE